jgi:hypothetical protein
MTLLSILYRPGTVFSFENKIFRAQLSGGYFRGAGGENGSGAGTLIRSHFQLARPVD